MTVYICDKCGKEVDSLFMNDLELVNDDAARRIHFDVCEDCKEEVLAFIEGGREE